MKIIISPAKKMRMDTDSFPCESLPVYCNQAAELMTWIRELSFEEQKKLWNCNDAIAKQNHARFEQMNLFEPSQLTPAILSYDGIQYQYMAPNVFDEEAYSYVEANLRILSGFYGVLKPMDGVTPYRLEMQAKGAPSLQSEENTGKGSVKNLYDYWSDKIYQEVVDDSRLIINLASKEYSKCVEKYLTPEDTFITCIFGELSNDKVVQKGVYAKMARGEMVRYLAEIRAESAGELKGFTGTGYTFDDKRSSEETYVFLK